MRFIKNLEIFLLSSISISFEIFVIDIVIYEKNFIKRIISFPMGFIVFLFILVVLILASIPYVIIHDKN